MTANEIRESARETINTVEANAHGDKDATMGGLLALLAFASSEIAAQLAELNQKLGKVIVSHPDYPDQNYIRTE